jgi:protoheme IX farnesyltransferase
MEAIAPLEAVASAEVPEARLELEAPGHAVPVSPLSDYVALARPRLATLGLMMVVLAYVIAGPTHSQPWLLAWLVIGSLCTLCGASALNQVLEVDADTLMRRTAGRPLPAGRVTPRAATVYGTLLVIGGLALLAWGVNGLTAASAALGISIYLFIYTPMKRMTSLSTVVGAVPGAVPVLMGWAAARAVFSHEAWLLFAILFLWQLPHFLAIAWMYRADYKRAGFQMLTTDDPSGALTARQVVNYGLVLIPISLLPAVAGFVGPVYFFGALALSVYYLAAGLHMARERTGASARRLLKASVYYLPLLFALLAFDRIAL